MKMNDGPCASATVLEQLYEAYANTLGPDTAVIKADFDELIYAVCTLCRDHEKAGFIEGVKVGIGLGQELAK